MIAQPISEAPPKCRPERAANVPENACEPPGSQLRCLICPASPTYHRRAEIERMKEAA